MQVQSTAPVNYIFESPILSLQNNILFAFENANIAFADELRNAIIQGQVSKDIDLILDCLPARGPFVTKEAKLKPAVMHLYVTHLEMLWAFIYGWMILFEEDIQKPQLAGRSVIRHGTTPLSARALALLSWAMQMGTQYQPWDKDLPSPITYADMTEKWYGEKANLVFQQAVAYFLAHEYAHIALGHLEIVLSLDLISPIRIEIEKEADVKAFEIAIGHDSGDQYWLSRPYAAVCAVLSSFCMIGRRPALLGPQSHPALHHRLNHLLSALNFQTEERKVYFCTLSAMALEQFFPHPHDLSGGPLFDTGEDWLQDVFDQLDTMMISTIRT
jgi:hypothetical protein